MSTNLKYALTMVKASVTKHYKIMVIKINLSSASFFWLGNHDAALTFALGTVEGIIGELHELVHVFRILGEAGNADAEGDLHRPLFYGDPYILSGEEVHETKGYPVRKRLACSGQHDYELVTTVAGRYIGRTHGQAYTPRKLLEHHIAHLMPVIVIHILEVVNVEHDAGEGLLVAFCLGNFEPQGFNKVPEVVQSGH